MLAIARLELNNFFARCWKSRGKSWKADAENGEQVVESREKPLRDLSPACRGKSWKADAENGTKVVESRCGWLLRPVVKTSYWPQQLVRNHRASGPLKTQIVPAQGTLC